MTGDGGKAGVSVGCGRYLLLLKSGIVVVGGSQILRYYFVLFN